MRLIAVGTRMPAWVDQAFDDYARRLRGSHRLELLEIPLVRRNDGDSDAQRARAKTEEGKRILTQLRTDETAIALDERGTLHSSRELAQWLPRWLARGQTSFLIGGPDGFAPEVLARAHHTWALSRLTLPHGLARVLLAEQLYRAVSLLAGHPYHRD